MDISQLTILVVLCVWGGEKNNTNRSVILRHDIDFSIDKAITIARLEMDLDVHSTYFVLITSNFYNILSKSSIAALKKIMSYGHNIGLHFDEAAYPDATYSSEKKIKYIQYEADILRNVLDRDIKVISYHRPSANILNKNLDIPGIVNSYSETFFHEFKYISDSRMVWREPVMDIIEKEMYPRLHILSHPFWYHDIEYNIADILKNYIDNANIERYRNLRDNITDLDSIILPEEAL